VWLNVVPDKSDESRLEQILKSGKQVIWPELRLTYLFEALLDVGGYMPNGMGNTPLTWQEINAWNTAIGFDLQPWEARILKSSSTEYVSQMILASKANCPPPGVVVENDPVKMAKHIKDTLRG
jgi:hypothetical protein